MENIYLKALEIGYNANENGISLTGLIGKLEELNYEFNKDLFRDWFYRSFEHKTRIQFINQPVKGAPLDIDEDNLRLSSDALFQYLEYVELKEARKNSKVAKTYSIAAILIALVSLLVSGGFSAKAFSHQQESEKQTENQLKELIEINIGNQKVLDSCLYELNKLRLISEEERKK